MPRDLHSEGAALASFPGDRPVHPGGRPHLAAGVMEEPDWARAVTRLCGAAPQRRDGRALDGHSGPVALRLEPERVVALSAAPLPEPFFRDDASWTSDGFGAWVMLRSEGALPPGAGLAHREREGSDTSALVTMARQANTRTLVDLTALKSTAVDGPPVAVGSALSEIVVELAVRRWSDVGELFLVGFGRDLGRLVGARFLAGLQEAREALAESYGSGALFALDGEAGEPGGTSHAARCFIIAPGLPGTGNHLALADFIASAEQAPATSVVCCDVTAPVRSVWQLFAHRQPRLVEIRRRGRVVGVIPLSEAAATEMAARRSAMSEAASTAAVPRHHRREGRPLPVGPGVEASPMSRTPSAAERAHSPTSQPTLTISVRGRREDRSNKKAAGIRVNVLGPVEVTGTAEDIRRRRSAVELLVYLAVHPEGVLGEVLATALWPDRRISTQTFANRLYEARTLLGRTHEGAPRLLRRGGLHVLAEDVSCDWTEFQALTGRGSGPAEWRQALDLVRGRPLQGLAGGDWTMLEGLNAMIEGAVVDAAVNLSEALLGASDTIGSAWAARRGLVVAPWDERLYRLLMLAADRNGNRKGIEAVLKSLAVVLDIKGDPLAAVHPATAELYRRLTSQYRSGAGVAE